MVPNISWLDTLRTSWTFIALICFSIVCVGIAIERSWYYFKRRGNPDKTLEDVTRLLHRGDIAEAVRASESCSHPMGPVAAQILRGEYTEEEEAEEQLQIGLSQQKLLLERNLGILGTAAAASPLLGLLGTVWGIMRAFSDMSVTGSGSPAVVAGGIAEALITTSVGIMIAVPSLLLYNAFARRMTVMLTVAENHTRTIRAALVAAKERRPAEPSELEPTMKIRRAAERRAEELEPAR
jgi:biopolymer transport protein ExbB